MKTCMITFTALTAACLHGRTLCVKFLLDSGADITVPNARFFTPLLCAVKCGRWEVCDLLLASGADLDTTDQYGCTPLMMAAREGHTTVLTLLLEKGKYRIIYFSAICYDKLDFNSFSLWKNQSVLVHLYVLWFLALPFLFIFFLTFKYQQDFSANTMFIHVYPNCPAHQRQVSNQIYPSTRASLISMPPNIIACGDENVRYIFISMTVFVGPVIEVDRWKTFGFIIWHKYRLTILI